MRNDLEFFPWVTVWHYSKVFRLVKIL